MLVKHFKTLQRSTGNTETVQIFIVHRIYCVARVIRRYVHQLILDRCVTTL